MPATIKKPSECSPQELADFKALALLDRETFEKGLDEKITGAEWLGLHYERDKLVAVAGLQRPVEGYKKGVFKKAGAESSAEDFAFEFCWAYTRDDYRGRGFCSELLQGILEQAGNSNMFAIVRSNNKRMADILQKQGFVLEGFPYSRRAHRYTFQLYLRAAPAPASTPDAESQKG